MCISYENSLNGMRKARALSATTVVHTRQGGFVFCTVTLGLCLNVLQCAGQGSPSTLVLTNLWQPDGPVHTVLEANGVVYLGGRFNYIGPYTGNQVALDPETGVRDTAFP